MDAVIIDKLEELEKTQKEFWNVSRETGNFLSILIKTAHIQNALELGTSNGYSGIWLGEALKHTGGHLTTVEFYEKRQSVAQNNFEICGISDVITTVCGSAKHYLEYLDENVTFDFVFIDASKPEYLDYFKLVKPHLRKGAIITADNVISHQQKVQPFIDCIMADSDFQTEILNLPAGLLISVML